MTDVPTLAPQPGDSAGGAVTSPLPDSATPGAPVEFQPGGHTASPAREGGREDARSNNTGLRMSTPSLPLPLVMPRKGPASPRAQEVAGGSHGGRLTLGWHTPAPLGITNLGEALTAICTLTTFPPAPEAPVYASWEARLKELTTHVAQHVDEELRFVPT
jgi:hypothetical protein